MSILKKGTDFGPTEQVTSTKLDNLVDNASFTDTSGNSVPYTGSTGTCLNGGGLEVTSGGQLQIQDAGVGTDELASTSVTTAKIASSAVTTAKIANSNVTNAKLATNAVSTAKITNDAVTQDKIADDAVGADQLASDAVVTASIVDANVTTAKIADSNVTTAKIADSNVTTVKIADDAVTNAKIASTAVDTTELASSAVTTAKIADSNVTKAKIENVANLKVLGNTSGSAAAPQEVTINDTDSMSDASATTLATSESIKAYVDTEIADFPITAPTGSTVATSGSVTLPGGLIMKFGNGVSTDDNDETFTFPTAFPNNHFCTNVSITQAGQAHPLGAHTTSLTGFTINRINNLNGNNTFSFISIGN